MKKEDTFKTMIDNYTLKRKQFNISIWMPKKRKVSTRIDNIDSQFQPQTLEHEFRS